MNINSKKYWENRFLSDWDNNNGDQQSKYFAKLAIENFPEWFKKILESKQLSICDWGCAEGDGTEILRIAFPNNKLEGIDFSVNAIRKAKQRYPQIDFISNDLLNSDLKYKTDVLFSSNTLEHFSAPWETIIKLSKYVTHFLVMLVPFREYNRIPEHESFFDFTTTKLLQNNWYLCHSKIIRDIHNNKRYWDGDQMLLIYCNNKILPSLNLSLSSIILESEKNNLLNFEELSKKLEQEIKNRKLIEQKIFETNKLLDLANTKLLHKENEIADRNLTLTKKAQEINTLIEKNISLESVNNNNFNIINLINSEKSALQEQLSIILLSRKWKYANKIAYFFNKIFPYDTNLRKFIFFLLKILRVVIKFFFKLLKKMITKFRYLKVIHSIRSSDLFDHKYFCKDIKCSRNTCLSSYLENPTSNPSKEFDQYYYRMINNLDYVTANPLIHFISSTEYSEYKYKYKTEFECIDKNKPSIAFQLDSFDKGGLEEIVFLIINNEEIKQKFNILIIIAGNKIGNFAKKTIEIGVPIFWINNNERALEYIIQKHQIKICHSHYSVFGLSIYKKNNASVIYTIHNNYIWGDDDFYRFRGEQYTYVDQFIAVSSQVKRFFSEKFGINSKRIKVINNGVDIESISNPKQVDISQYQLAKKDFIITNVASFIPNKFHISMIVALSKIINKYKNIKLLFIGNILDQTYFNYIKSSIRKYKLTDNVRIIDYLPKKKLLSILQQSNIFLLPSLTEGFSVSTIEAMFYELPLILSDIGGARDTIINKDIGLIVKNPYKDIIDMTPYRIVHEFYNDENVNNKDDIANAISEIYVNYEKWKEKAKLGRKKVIEKFNINRMAKEHLDLYNKNLKTKSETSISKINTLSRLVYKEPLISVMMPVYNHKELVGHSIQSVLNQTYQNWELIILDDGSTDGLLDYLSQYKNEKRIKIYSQQNQKLPMALTHLHKLASGDFLTWTSADNIMENKMLETLSTFLIKNPDCSLCYADVAIIDENGDYIFGPGYRDNERDHNKPYIIRLPQDSSYLGLECDNYINACFMYRKQSSLINEGKYDVELTGLEDYDYWLRLSRTGKVKHIQNTEPLYKYRVHKNTMSQELLTNKKDEHQKKLVTFFEYEKQRQNYYRLFQEKNSVLKLIKKRKIIFDGKMYSFTSRKNTIVSLSVGYDINPIAKKARDYNSQGNYCEYGSLEISKQIVGIHCDVNEIDLPLLQEICKNFENYFFVLVSTNNNIADDINNIFKDIKNFKFLGYKDFGKPYQLYASWKAILIPPFKKNINNIDNFLTLSWACGKYLLYTKNQIIDPTQPFTMEISALSKTSLVDFDIDLRDNRVLLDKYIESYSTRERENKIFNYYSAYMTQLHVKRPIFTTNKITETLPKLITYKK